MDAIYVLRGRMQELYAGNSKVIDKICQFLLALFTFAAINHSIGFMKIAASPFVTLALAVVCTFLPIVVTILAATVLILAHTFSVSLGIFAITAMIFLIMYIFYLRLTPKMVLVMLLMPLAFYLKIPYVIPMACGLVSTPISLVAVACGTIVYYMMSAVKNIAAGTSGEDASGMLSQITEYVKQIFQSKEMWIVIVAMVICLFVVYTVRRMSVDHAWKIAIVAGAIANFIVIVIGDLALGVHTSYVALIVGSVASIFVGLILEIFYFSVDYARSESLQFEDDEYYYYVKAVPKVSVTTPEKTVKRINERQETEIIDAETVRRRSGEMQQGRRSEAAGKKMVKDMRNQGKRSPKKGPAAKSHDMKDVDKMLLTQSLRKDLNMRD